LLRVDARTEADGGDVVAELNEEGDAEAKLATVKSGEIDATTVTWAIPLTKINAKLTANRRRPNWLAK
jgi:hypothetical protein